VVSNTGSYLSIRVANIKVISGGMTEMGWGTFIYEPSVSSNIQRDSVQ
jgi:hypothetical protein